MLEPPQDRDLAKLHPMFRAALESWLFFARAWTHYDIKIGECLRTQERQDYLYSLGRTQEGKIVTWTLDSMHRYGLAADIILIDRVTGAAVWDKLAFQQLYAVSRPSMFGLKTLGEIGDWPHLEWINAEELINNKAVYAAA